MGKYTTGGARRTGNRKAGSSKTFTEGHRKAIVGHTMRPTAVHGHKRAT